MALAHRYYRMIAETVNDTFKYDNLELSIGTSRNETIAAIEYYKAELCRKLVEKFKADNTNFNKDRFYDACGIPLAK